MKSDRGHVKTLYIIRPLSELIAALDLVPSSAARCSLIHLVAGHTINIRCAHYQSLISVYYLVPRRLLGPG